jgi:signal transduction histidine kinase
MEEIEVAIFAIDDQDCLRLVNRAGEKLLGHPVERLLGRTAEELGLAECLRGAPSRIMEVVFPGSVGRWDMRRGTFRQGGLPHQLIVLSDLSRALREEERRVWQRLIRVLGHELNNSLAPIKSLAGSLESILNREPRSSDWQQDMQKGLSVIATRAESLSNFMGSYTRLARLPQPKFQPVDVETWVKRVIGLETRMQIQFMAGRSIVIQGDVDQLEQLLINLLRNAVDAALETGGNVCVGWHPVGTQLELFIEDEGPGLANPANVFVPFFTTKPGGSGIGLVLSRQIAEAHGGTLTLENRNIGHGCRVRVRLPV